MDFNEIVKIHSSQIKKIITLKVINKADREDIYQEVLIKLLKKIDTFESKSKITTWIHSVTDNTIIDFFRVNYKESFINIENVHPKELQVQDNPETLFEAKELITTYENLNIMDYKRRNKSEIESDNLNLDEISKRIDIPKTEIINEIKNIKKRVKK
jgi:RNA polymerase sigma factor (sigma-70 family)